MSESVLLATLPPLTGGVPTKAAILARHLRAMGHRVVVAHYATLRDYPDLSPPVLRRLAGRRPGTSMGTCFGDFECVSIGVAFPELEFTYYGPSDEWRRLIEDHDRHIAAGGTVLVSYPMAEAGIDHLTWCASTMIDDRIDRRRAMPWPRRWLDGAVVGPIQRRMEQRILSAPGRFMAVSTYARDSLVAAGGRAARFDMVPIPVDLGRYVPASGSAEPGVIGFAGRLTDPRKRLPLLLEAIAILARQGRPVRLRLTGDPAPALQARAAALGIGDVVSWEGWLSEEDLPAFYQGLDVFVIPSTREGLSIAGVQALACGVPVISTRCGGPEDYVVDGETGYLVDPTAGALADAVARIAGSRTLRGRLSVAARALAERDYSYDRFAAAFEGAWDGVYGAA